MAMTLIQLETYLISEIENLHLRIDETSDALESLKLSMDNGFATMNRQFQLLFARIDAMGLSIDNHKSRISQLESK